MVEAYAMIRRREKQSVPHDMDAALRTLRDRGYEEPWILMLPPGRERDEGMHPLSQVRWVVRGHPKMQIDDETIQLEPGDLVEFVPGSRHVILPPDEPVHLACASGPNAPA